MAVMVDEAHLLEPGDAAQALTKVLGHSASTGTDPLAAAGRGVAVRGRATR